MSVLSTIAIGINPNILDIGPFLLSWHGFLTFVAVATAVYLTYRWGTGEGMDQDAILSVAVWGIIAGIVGARVFHVADLWGPIYSHNPLSVFYVWQGGIAIYGAIIGGFIGCVTYMLARNSGWLLNLWRKRLGFLGEAKKAPLPGIGHLADLTAPALLIAMAIGRIGDIINGEHCALATRMPWGLVYTHPDSPGSWAISLGGCGGFASHPAVAYELLFDLALLLIIWPMRHRLRPHGMTFALYGALYSTGRFFISFLRVETNNYWIFNEAQIVALAVVIITIPLLVYKAQLVQVVRPSRGRS